MQTSNSPLSKKEYADSKFYLHTYFKELSIAIYYIIFLFNSYSLYTFAVGVTSGIKSEFPGSNP